MVRAICEQNGESDGLHMSAQLDIVVFAGAPHLNGTGSVAGLCAKWEARSRPRGLYRRRRAHLSRLCWPHEAGIVDKREIELCAYVCVCVCVRARVRVSV